MTLGLLQKSVAERWRPNSDPRNTVKRTPSSGVAAVIADNRPFRFPATYSSPQRVELFAVCQALQMFPSEPSNIYTDSEWVFRSSTHIESATISSLLDDELYQLLSLLQSCCQQRTAAYFVGHIRSHSLLPGLLSARNAAADKLCFLTENAVQRAANSHAIHHQNAHSLRLQFKITREAARAIVKHCSTCPQLQPVPHYGVNPRGLQPLHLWQMDVTHYPPFGKSSYIHVCVDTFSGFLLASALSGEAVKDVKAHLLYCLQMLGIPRQLKTDNAPAYVAKAFHSFLAQFNISRCTGIPYNPQGQGIVERAHSTIKHQLEKIKKGELYPRTPANYLHHALYVLNFLRLDAAGRSAAERFWHPEASTKALGLMADLGGFRRGSSGMRNGFLVSRMRNLGLHTPPSSPPGVRHGAPRRCQRPRRLALETHNSPFPTWGQIKRLVVTAQDMLTTEGKPFTPENLFLAMLAHLSFQVLPTEGKIYWAYVPEPPLLRPVTWNDANVPVYTNNTDLFGGLDGDFIIPVSTIYNYTGSTATLPICLSFTPKAGCLTLGHEIRRVAGYLPTALHTIVQWQLSFWGFSTEAVAPNSQHPPHVLPLCPVVRPGQHVVSKYPVWQSCAYLPGTQHQIPHYDINLTDWSRPYAYLPPISGARNVATGDWTMPIITTQKGRVQEHIWRAAAALGVVEFLYPEQTTPEQTTPKRVRTGLRACVRAPYVFLSGPFNITVQVHMVCLRGAFSAITQLRINHQRLLLERKGGTVGSQIRIPTHWQSLQTGK
ncbi:uncharacterized protein LOC131383361 [Hylobates moloch]|uniref:uncharacterized protein LOC131383361 n=1 Tax=Hylobates moloch TaxID=81572 RepID=UPI002676C07C|nr:uncharacterized protein LOC131383361 [Hylobates moloch]